MLKNNKQTYCVNIYAVSLKIKIIWKNKKCFLLRFARWQFA